MLPLMVTWLNLDDAAIGLDMKSPLGTMAAVGLLCLTYAVALFLLEFLMRGWTPGKWVFGIRVVRMDGRPAAMKDLALRNLLKCVDLALIPLLIIIWYVGNGMGHLFLNWREQRIGDRVAGTMVVTLPRFSKRRRRQTPRSTEAPKPVTLSSRERRRLLDCRDQRDLMPQEAHHAELGKALKPILKRRGLTLPDESVETMERTAAYLLQKADESEQ